MKKAKFLAYLLSGIVLAGCGVQVGSDSARTPVTGSAGGATSQGGMAQLERCDQSLGTLAVLEDQASPWFHRLQYEYKLPSTVPLIRLLVQQSNCFVVVERGRGFSQLQNERALDRTGELRQGSNSGGQRWKRRPLVSPSSSQLLRPRLPRVYGVPGTGDARS